MLGVAVIGGIVLVIEVAAETFRLEPKPLVEEHCWVVSSNVKSNVFSHASLYEVIKHEGAYATPLPIRVDQKKGDISFIHTHVWDQKTTPNSKLPIQSYHSEIWVLKTLSHINALPEEMCY